MRFARARWGLTLLELLVVVVILVTVTAAAIPMMVPAVETRRLREAARSVGTFLAKARALAIESGRPVGVQFSASVGSVGAEASETLHIVEVPPPFAGLATDSAVILTRTDPNLFSAEFGIMASDGSGTLSAPETLPPNMIRVGDLLQVSYQGALYRIVSGTGTGEYVTDNVELEIVSSGIEAPWPYLPAPNHAKSPALPYKIIRQPVRSSSQSYTLPTGTVVDMVHSGVGDGQFDLTGGSEFGILFAPSGAVQGMFDSQTVFDSPYGTVTLPVHFLIGKSEKLPVVDNAGNENFRDLQCLWVSVGNQTGQVVTSPMASATNVSDSRAFARDARGMGGK